MYIHIYIYVYTYISYPLLFPFYDHELIRHEPRWAQEVSEASGVPAACLSHLPWHSGRRALDPERICGGPGEFLRCWEPSKKPSKFKKVFFIRFRLGFNGF